MPESTGQNAPSHAKAPTVLSVSYANGNYLEHPIIDGNEETVRERLSQIAPPGGEWKVAHG